MYGTGCLYLGIEKDFFNPEYFVMYNRVFFDGRLKRNLALNLPLQTEPVNTDSDDDEGSYCTRVAFLLVT